MLVSDTRIRVVLLSFRYNEYELTCFNIPTSCAVVTDWNAQDCETLLIFQTSMNVSGIPVPTVHVSILKEATSVFAQTEWNS